MRVQIGSRVAAYVDASCLLKLVIEEPDSEAVARLAFAQTELVVSSLTELEVRTALRAFALGDVNHRRHSKRRVALFEALLQAPPIVRVSVREDAFSHALAHVELKTLHCRTLDRLHLGIMQSMNMSRLLTTDVAQAKAARALGFKIGAPK